MELGKMFSDLHTTGDYRFAENIDPVESGQAIAFAGQIISAVYKTKPAFFPLNS